MAIIKLSNVNLNFPMTYVDNRSLRNNLTQRIINKNKNFSFKTSLENINLEFNDGDFVGILGPNGSGKSSLLRIIAGIYYPNSGGVLVEGKVLTLLDLNTGLEPESTGYENIYLISFMRGYTKDQIDKFIDKVVEFSGLEEAIFKPVRTYSSGMMMRLSASIILHFEADILLLDEFISTGDKDFKKKFDEYMSKKLEFTKIVILASHSEETVKKLCNKIIYLNSGKIDKIE